EIQMDDTNNNGRTPESDIIVGISMILLSVVIGVWYSIILVAMWKDKELIRMTSYKFMFVLGWCDVIQCIPHAMMGVLASPFYVSYAILTVILSINRFVQLASPRWDLVLFSPTATTIRIGNMSLLVTKVSKILISMINQAYFRYFRYSWAYDFTLPASFPVKTIAMSIQVHFVIFTHHF
ncbi:hypothetical protein PMAYCL1PPCAC_25191, partial [Pristionchus mayeri]